MALNYPDKKIEKVIGEGTSTAGTDYTEDIPVHDESATAEGKFTFDSGFPPLTSQPLTAGGYPPRRNDENGILRLFSKWLFWFQSGGYSKYDATLDYKTGCVIYHNGERYWCIADNGASSTVVTPGTNLNYWKPFTRSISLSGKASGTGTISTGNTVINVTGITVSKWDTARTITLSGDVTGTTTMDGSKNVTITTTANQATKLKTARTIAITGDASGSATFDGTANATLNTTVAKATQLRTARTIALSGDASGSASFNGTANATINATVAVATKLRTARNINGVAFDGTKDITITAVPIGAVLPFAGSSLPSGYLWCNGATYSRTTYAALFAVIGTAYGYTSSSNFCVPNLVDNRFIEGSMASSRGTARSAGLPEIYGEYDGTDIGNDTDSPSVSGCFNWRRGSRRDASNGNQGNQIIIFSAKKANSIYGNSSTVQPKSLCMPYIIRAN